MHNGFVSDEAWRSAITRLQARLERKTHLQNNNKNKEIKNETRNAYHISLLKWMTGMPSTYLNHVQPRLSQSESLEFVREILK